MKRHKKNTRRAATAREPISKKLRFDVLNRDGFKCRYCGQSAPDVVLHADHVIPVAKGGTNSPDNLVSACSSCNGGKSDTEIIKETTENRVEFHHSAEILDFFSAEDIKRADALTRLIFNELYSYTSFSEVRDFLCHTTELLVARGTSDIFTKLAANILEDICDQANLSDLEGGE
jgi:hypothetical protein